MKNIYINMLILVIIIIIFNNNILLNYYCNDINLLLNTNNNELLNQIKQIDPLFFENILNFTGELFTIDIKLNLLNTKFNKSQLSILKEILNIEERLFELFLFTSSEDFNSYDSILNTMNITSPIKKVKIVHSNTVDFAEFGTCTLLDRNKKLIKASFILIKHTGSSENLYNICKENVLLDFEIFRKSIIQLRIPRRLEMIMYSIQSIDNVFNIFNKLQILIKRNYGLGFCIIYNNHLEGFIVAAYDTTSEVQWYLRFINLKHIKFIIKTNNEINTFLSLQSIKENFNIYLESFIKKWEWKNNNKFIPILNNKQEDELWNNFKENYKFETIKNKTLNLKKLK